MAVEPGPRLDEGAIRNRVPGPRSVAAYLVGLPTFRCYLNNTHVATETLKAGYFQFLVNTGVGDIRETFAGNLGAINFRPTQPDDEIHLSLLIDDPSHLTEGRIMFDVDSATNDFQHNFLYFPFRASDLTPAVQGSADSISTQQAAIGRAQVDQVYGRLSVAGEHGVMSSASSSSSTG